MVKYLLVFLTCLTTNSLHAMTWTELQAEIDSVEAGNPGNRDIILRFSEIVQTAVVYNRAVQESEPGAQLFCPPPDTPMTLDEIVSLVRAESRREPASAERQVQVLMLDGFRRRYPCP